MTGNLFNNPVLQALDSTGAPISGAKLNFYSTGTSSRKNTYSESTLTTANTNPVVADSAGRFGPIYLLADGAYKVVFTDADDNTIKTFDPVDARVATVVAATLAGTASSTGLSASGGVLSLAINSLTEDTSPDVSSDFVATYDNSASGLKKVKPANLLALPRSYLAGCGVSDNATTDYLDIAAGVCRDSTNAANITLSALTKQFNSTFAAGTNQGGFASGESLPTSGTIHIWAISKTDGTADVFANDHATSGLSPTLPTGYSYKRRIASRRTNSSGHIITGTQIGDEFLFDSPILDINANNPGTSAVSATLSTPAGVQMLALFNVYHNRSADGERLYISSLDTTDTASSTSAAPLSTLVAASDSGFGPISIRTSTSSQIRYRVSASSASIDVRIATLGWIDTRGRDD